MSPMERMGKWNLRLAIGSFMLLAILTTVSVGYASYYDQPVAQLAYFGLFGSFVIFFLFVIGLTSTYHAARKGLIVLALVLFLGLSPILSTASAPIYIGGVPNSGTSIQATAGTVLRLTWNVTSMNELREVGCTLQDGTELFTLPSSGFNRVYEYHFIVTNRTINMWLTFVFTARDVVGNNLTHETDLWVYQYADTTNVLSDVVFNMAMVGTYILGSLAWAGEVLLDAASYIGGTVLNLAIEFWYVLLGMIVAIASLRMGMK